MKLSQFFWLALFYTVRTPVVIAYGLDDYDLLKAACAQRDTCHHHGRAKHFHERNCECDLNCAVYADCCVDAPARSMTGLFQRRHHTCMGYGQGPQLGAYVIGECARGYHGPHIIRERCETHLGASDPLVMAPVTDETAGVTYQNRHCAECNNADLSNLKTWLIALECESVAKFGLNDSYVWQHLHYAKDQDLWGVRFGDSFHVCSLMFDKPVHVATRQCRPDVVSSCPDSWHDDSFRKSCASYSGLVHDGKTTYKNVHCAICNGQRSGHLQCGRVTGVVRRAMNFALLMHFGQKGGNKVGIIEVELDRVKCHGKNSVYDPFKKACRQLTCALPGFVLHNGKCKRQHS